MVCAIYVTSLGGGGGRCCRGAEVPKHFEGLSHARTSNGDCRTAKQNFSSGRMIAEFLAWMQQVKSTLSNFLFYLNLYASQWLLCAIGVFLDWPVYRPVIDIRRIWINLLIWWPCYCEQGDRRLFSHSVLFNIVLMEFSCCVVWISLSFFSTQSFYSFRLHCCSTGAPPACKNRRCRLSRTRFCSVSLKAQQEQNGCFSFRCPLKTWSCQCVAAFWPD